MTSKEALDFLNGLISREKHIDSERNKKINECYNLIKKDLEALEILKKCVYYSPKSHCIRMREIRKSTFNFDYEDLKEWLENE